MAKVTRAGFFGWEDSLKVSGSFAANSQGQFVWTTDFAWIPGMCFKLYHVDPTYGLLCDSAGEQIYGIALDDDLELEQPPSAQMVTILHGHSLIQIDHTAEVAAGTTTAGYLAYSKTLVEASQPMNLLYTDGSGKLTTASGSYSGSRPAGFVVQVPALANNFTLKFILFG